MKPLKVLKDYAYVGKLKYNKKTNEFWVFASTLETPHIKSLLEDVNQEKLKKYLLENNYIVKGEK